MSNNFANIDFLGQALELEACARVTESQPAERAMSRAARTLRDTLDYVGEHKKRLKERDDYAESLRANNYELEQQLSEACAKLCEDNCAGYDYAQAEFCLTEFPEECGGRHDGMTYAKAIRERGEKK